MTFKEFYTDFLRKSSESPITVHDAIVRAFDAGQASRNVITAHQLQSEIAKSIAAHDEETNAMTDRLWENGEKQASMLTRIARDKNIEKYRDALMIVVTTLERMEAERAGEALDRAP